MTTELEKQFFDTFGIEPKELIFRTMNCACGCHDCKNCEKYKNNFSKIYPKITDKHYLELICIHNTYLRTRLYGLDYESLEKEILKDLINEQESREFKTYYADDMKHQVQAIFKGDK